MDIYYEQSVAGKNGRIKAILYALCWVLIVLLLLASVMLAANALGTGTQEMQINWLNVILLALCLALAGLLFMRKDGLRMEYDYILQNDTLEIYGILNRRRRRRLARIGLHSVKSCGRVGDKHYAGLSRQGRIKQSAWCGERSGYYLYYMDGNQSRMALLDLDDQIAALIHRQLPVGVWQN